MKKLLVLFVLLSAPTWAQSTNQDFPSPVVTDEVGAQIAPRDIGDARLTRHFYTFFTGVGDLLLDIETENLNGDIDLFEAKTLRPLSKISIYASSTSAKTNRIVYFRKREQVLMRVEGRTPNDDLARYKIKISGVFVAATDLPRPPEDLEPRVENQLSPQAVARVNAVGTIIETLPKKAPVEEPEAEVEPEEKPAEIVPERRSTTTARRNSTPRRSTAARRTQPPKTVETEETAEPKTTPTAKTATPRTRTPARTTARRTPSRRTPTAARKPEPAPPKPNPLANIRLQIILKNGDRIERPMSEVLRVNVDKDGNLTVITMSGKMEKYSLLDVEKFSIEQ